MVTQTSRLSSIYSANHANILLDIIKKNLHNKSFHYYKKMIVIFAISLNKLVMFGYFQTMMRRSCQRFPRNPPRVRSLCLVA